MLRKLLKYDMKSVFNIWWIMAVSVIGISIFGGLCLRDVIHNIENNEYFPWAIAGVIITYIAYIAFSLVTMILVYVRFYKNFFSDEGYLTFTLPVKRSKLLLSKLLNNLIWSSLTTAVLMVGVIIILAICPFPEDISVSLLSHVADICKSFISENLVFDGNFMLIPYFIELVLALTLISATGNLFLYFCVTVASVVAKKHKVLVAIAMVYGSNIVLSFLQMIFTFSFSFWTMSAEAVLSSIPMPSGSEFLALVFFVLLLICVAAALICAVMWFITLSCLERKLNLS